jgi:hypothetical protein
VRGSCELKTAGRFAGGVIWLVASVLVCAGVAWGAGSRSLQQTAAVTARPAPGASRPRVKRPGQPRFVVLTRGEKLPEGTLVDVSGKSAIELFDSQGHEMTFSGLQPGSRSRPNGVSSLFAYKGLANGYIALTLVGGDFSTSRRFSGSATASKPARRLWGSGEGHFSTSGRFAAAAVRGTIWEMADYTNGSLCTDKRGLVSVRDLVKRTTVLLRTGQSYFAAKRR